MDETRKSFPEISFDDFFFVSTLKRIPPKITSNTVHYVADAFAQHAELYRIIKWVSEVSNNRKIEIKNLKPINAQKKIYQQSHD